MRRIRRQNSDTSRTKDRLVTGRRKSPLSKDCFVPARRNQEAVARMGQVDPRNRAVQITARRGQKDGLYKISDIDGKLVGTEFTQGHTRSAQRWEKDESDLPERMIEKGEMRPEDFPRPFRDYLNLKE